MIRSGASAAIFSISMPLVFFSRVGELGVAEGVLGPRVDAALRLVAEPVGDADRHDPERQQGVLVGEADADDPLRRRLDRGLAVLVRDRDRERRLLGGALRRRWRGARCRRRRSRTRRRRARRPGRTGRRGRSVGWGSSVSWSVGRRSPGSGRVGARCLAGGGLLEHRRELARGRTSGSAGCRSRWRRRASRRCRRRGSPSTAGSVADGAEVLQLVEHAPRSSVAKTMTSASIRPTFSAEICACAPSSGAYSSRPGGDREPEVGEEVGAEAVRVDVELAVVGAALRERRGQARPTRGAPRRRRRTRSSTSSTSAWPSASRPSAAGDLEGLVLPGGEVLRSSPRRW